ncbi:MAG TPA: pseudouridine synthase [Chroococcidiopsis sp.]
MLHPISAFIADAQVIYCSQLNPQPQPSYWYEGQCPRQGLLLRLPRTALAEAIAQGLVRSLEGDRAASREGKMYGVLLVGTPEGEVQVLKAFSGLWQGQSVVPGWVPPIPGRDQVAMAEARTLQQLDAIKQELLALRQQAVNIEYEQRSQQFAAQWQDLSHRHAQRKQARQQQRQHYQATLTGAHLQAALSELDDQSRRDGIERRQLKRQRDQVLQPFKQALDATEARIRTLKAQRKDLSRQLQAQLHAAYCLQNFAGETLSLQQMVKQGITGSALPTGTGDCCAPKLLHYAAVNNLTPLAMAEIWWGPASSQGDRLPGQFYGACAERCQPLIGFLLSGVEQRWAESGAESRTESRTKSWDEAGDRPVLEFAPPLSLPSPFSPQSAVSPPRPSAPPMDILYEDEWLIAVDKPSGLLSVPGRDRHHQDSVFSRLRCSLPDGAMLLPVHRLDQDTSGVLLLARDRQTYLDLSQQFQQRRVHKTYEALLAGQITIDAGTIDLPLWGDPRDRPYQSVNWQHGKPSTTQFQVLHRQDSTTRIAFIPITGRTHQLRVHAAAPAGLGVPIVGDRLYGRSAPGDRLYLHATTLQIQHPYSGCSLLISAPLPF